MKHASEYIGMGLGELMIEVNPLLEPNRALVENLHGDQAVTEADVLLAVSREVQIPQGLLGVIEERLGIDSTSGFFEETP